MSFIKKKILQPRHDPRQTNQNSTEYAFHSVSSSVARDLLSTNFFLTVISLWELGLSCCLSCLGVIGVLIGCVRVSGTTTNWLHVFTGQADYVPYLLYDGRS
jgi:hypothetical protein